MVTQSIERKLLEKSTHHRAALKTLAASSGSNELSKKVLVLPAKRQVMGMNTILHDIDTQSEDFIFYFDRLASLLIEQ